MPKRIKDLWPRIACFENLLIAHNKARGGKRGRPEVQAFEYDLERNILQLLRELQEGSYIPSPYRTFVIQEPKQRVISAAPYRDRVVHHALMNIVEPILDARMDTGSFACRKGKGTHAALDRFTVYSRRYEWVWHGDIRKFFPSIDHLILKGQTQRIIKDKRVLVLINRIIDATSNHDDVQTWFPGDTLLTPLERPRGLPIGNLTSQWLANYYLTGLDNFVRHELRMGAYIRYCDDFCLFHESKSELVMAMYRCKLYLRHALRLELNQKHLHAHSVKLGERFLGMRVFPFHRRMDPQSLARSVRRLKRRISREGLSFNRNGQLGVAIPWIAHLSHADNARLRGKIITRIVRTKSRLAPEHCKT